MSYTSSRFTVELGEGRSQARPAISPRPEGGFDVVWQDGGSFSDGVTKAVQGASFAANGAETTQFATGGSGDRDQLDPDVTTLANGNTVVTWQDGETTPGPDTPAELTTIRGEVRGPDGDVLNTFDIPGRGQDDQIEPAVTALSTGGFAMAREGTAGDAEGVIFDSDGAVRARFSATDEVGIVQSDVDITGLSDGRIAMTWRDFRGDAADVVQGAVFAADGTHQQRFSVSAPEDGAQYAPAITGLDDGGFVVAWQEGDGFGEGGGAGIADRVRGNVFDAEGQVVRTFSKDPEQGAAADATWDNILPDVTTLSDGNFAVAWQHSRFPNKPDPLKGAVFTPEGEAVDSFALENAGQSDHERPKLAPLAGGDMAAVWQHDADPDAIKGAVFETQQRGTGDEATFTGSVTGRWTDGIVASSDEMVDLDNDALGTVVVDNADAGGTSDVDWGRGASVFDAPSGFSFDGAGSDAGERVEVGTGELFSLGTFDYDNGRTASSSHDFGGAVLSLDIAMNGVDETLSSAFTFDVKTTQNRPENTAAENGDFVDLRDGSVTRVFEKGGRDYTFEIVGFSEDDGTTFTRDFDAPEADGRTAEVFARITRDEPGANTPPAAADDSAETDPGEQIAIDVLGNDNDPDGDTLVPQVRTETEHGELAVRAADNKLLYTPDEGFEGTDTFTYTVSDGNGGTDTAEVTVAVGDASSSDGGSASLLLDADVTYPLAAETPETKVFNAAGGETLQVGVGSTVDLSGFQTQDGGDVVQLANAAAGYTVAREGGAVTLTNGVTTLTVDAGKPTAIQFADTTLTLAADAASGTVTLGEQVVANGAEPAEVTAAGDGQGHNNAGLPGVDGGAVPRDLTDADGPVDAGADSFDFTLDASEDLGDAPLRIENFGGSSNDDTLAITNADDVIFSAPGEDIQIETAAGATSNTVTLVGANPGGNIAFGEGSAESILGYDAFEIA